MGRIGDMEWKLRYISFAGAPVLDFNVSQLLGHYHVSYNLLV